MKTFEHPFVVDKPTTLLAFLLAQINHLSRNAVKSLLKNGVVRVNGATVKQFDTPLRVGDSVEIGQQRRDATLPGLIYEDAQLLVLNKPAGLLTVADEREKLNTAYRLATDYLKAKEPDGRLFVVHRLDRDTSGLVVFAKQESVKQALQDNWANVARQRGYTALVEGRVALDADRLTSWLFETKTHLVVASETPEGGQKAVTDYRVMVRGDEFSLLDLRLHTGRKNQIRVQLQQLGHPVVGDKKYGAKANPVRRLCLHAHLLELAYPIADRVLTFEAPAPPAWRRLAEGGEPPAVAPRKRKK